MTAVAGPVHPGRSPLTRTFLTAPIGWMSDNHREVVTIQLGSKALPPHAVPLVGAHWLALTGPRLPAPKGCVSPRVGPTLPSVPSRSALNSRLRRQGVTSNSDDSIVRESGDRVGVQRTRVRPALVLSQSRRRLPLRAAGRVCACAVESTRAVGACAGSSGRPPRPRREPRLRGPGPEAVAAAMEPEGPRNELVSAEGRNRKAVLCQRCGSRVLQPGTALFSRRQVGAGRGSSGALGGAALQGRASAPGSQVLLPPSHGP